MTRRFSRRWLWYFGVLVVLAVIAVTLEVGYNLGQQLTAVQLESARRRWQEHGPRAYDLVYAVKLDDGEPDVLEAHLHHGEVDSVMDNGRPLEPVLYPFHDLPGLYAAVARTAAPGAAGQAVAHATTELGPLPVEVQVRQGKVVRATWNDRLLDPALEGHYDMDALFAAIARRLELDAAPDAPRVFAVGTFDKQDGHLLHYVRSVRRPRQRIEISLIRLRPQ
jgi:hypothetical protein